MQNGKQRFALPGTAPRNIELRRATIEESSRESSAAEQRQPARLRAVGAVLLRIGDTRADGETLERTVRDAVAMEVDFPAVAAEDEAVSLLGPQLRHGSDRLRGMRLDLAAHAPDLILQAPPRALERVVNREVEVEKALVRCRSPCDRDFPPVRQRHMDVDLVVAARPVMGARCLNRDAKGGYAPVALLDVRDAFENARPRFGDRLHPMEVDLRRRFHQQLHSGDPAPARPQAASGGLQRGAMIALMLW